MAVKGTGLGLDTQYPTKTDMQIAATEMIIEKALAALQELVESTLLTAEPTKAISKGTQSQLIE